MKTVHAAQPGSMDDISLNGVLQRLSGLERGRFGSGDLHGLLGLGVEPCPRRPLHDLKGPEADQLDFIAALEGVTHGGGKGVQRGLAVFFGQAAFFSHNGDQFTFVHDAAPFC